MNSRPILIVAGEPNSIFFEILFKFYKSKKTKKPIILIASHKLLNLQMKKLNFKKKIKVLDESKVKNYKLNNNSINLININYNQKKAFQKISKKSNDYINNCFTLALNLIKKGVTDKLINGPISKKTFLGKEYLGITEYLAQKSNKKNFAMLIFNKKLSVSPITTHLPVNDISKSLNKPLIIGKIILINNFYKKFFGFKPAIAVTGLNPHCESIKNYNEDEKIIKPAVKSLNKRGLKIFGPFAADTIFLKKNRSKYDVIIGMYHDQVLTPMKTLVEYDAINITLGLPFLRVSPDHGPNENMIGKNLSNPQSLINAINFLEKIK